MREAVLKINENLEALIKPLKHLTTSIEAYTGGQSADASVTVSSVEATEQSDNTGPDAAAEAAEAEARKAAQVAAGSAAPAASGSAVQEAQEAQGAQGAQEAAGSAAQGAQAAPKASENVPAFKTQKSNITFNNSDGKMGTNYFQIMNVRIPNFFKKIDAQIKNADTEDQEMLRERKVKYERVKKLLQDATTEAEVNTIIKDNQVMFNSNIISSGGTRKPRMHRRKKTQRKRSKTIKKKIRAGKRK